MRAGPRNLITDVDGLSVGQANDGRIKSGVSVVLCETPCVAAVQVLGGAPGTRETDLLEPHNMVETIHGIALSGGSAFGLDAASGVQAYLREQGIGFEIGPHRIPIVPSAILFDLINGGDKDWGRYPPYRELGFMACENAGTDFALGSYGAGTGAITATIKGGLGSASSVLDKGAQSQGFHIGALSAVNPIGTVTIGDGPHFWAAPFELGNEFGGYGLPSPMPADATDLRIKFRELKSAQSNTTIAVIATDAILTKAEAKRMAISAHDGFARAIWPSHTSFDGDLVFALATGRAGRKPSPDEFIDLCAAATSTMARSIARGVFEAEAQDNDLKPSWRSLYG